MTHVHAPVIRSHAEIAEQARNIHPVQFTVRTVITLLSAVFVAVGWSIGRTWFLFVFTVLWAGSRLAWLASCMKMGYALGRKHNIVPERE